MDIEKLRNLTLFIGLDDDKLKKISEIIVEKEFEPGEVIISEGEIGDALYLIQEGTIDIVKEKGPEKKVVAKLTPSGSLIKQYEGDFFGEMSILDLEPRSATAIASEKTILFYISRNDLMELFHKDKDLHLFILSNMARTLSRRIRAIPYFLLKEEDK